MIGRKLQGMITEDKHNFGVYQSFLELIKMLETNSKQTVMAMEG